MSWNQIVTDEDKRVTMQRVWEMVCRGAKKGPVLVTLGRPNRSYEQNAKFHTLISEIREQGAITDPEGNSRPLINSSLEDVKAALVDAFSAEMDAQGTPLRKPSRHTWNWIDKRFVYVRPSTTEFNKEEAGNFIEFLYMTGSEMGVQWSPVVTEIYNDYREAK